MLQAPVNPQIEYLKIGFTFAGTLLGTMIGAPLLEAIKDRLLANRQWTTQRNEIVTSIRLIKGIFGAFDQLRIEAFGRKGLGMRTSIDATALVPIIQFSEAAFQRLSKFDLSVVDPHLAKLSALHPDESQKSAVAQRLIVHILITKSHFQHLQTFEPISITDMTTRAKSPSLSDSDCASIQASDEKYNDPDIFLEALYAKRLGIKSFSLTADSEIMSAERKLSQLRADKAMSEYDKKRAEYLAEFGDHADSKS
jgi:hypothetical protein